MSDNIVVDERPKFKFEEDFTLKDLNIFDFYNLSNKYGGLSTEFKLIPKTPRSISIARIAMTPNSLYLTSFTNRMLAIEIEQDEKLTYQQLAMAEAILKMNNYFKQLQIDDSALPLLTKRLSEIASTSTSYRANTRKCLKLVQELNNRENKNKPFVVRIDKNAQLSYSEYDESALNLEELADELDKHSYALRNTTFVHPNHFLVTKSGFERINCPQDEQ